MEDRFFLWLIDGDNLLEVNDNFSRDDMPRASAFGILYDGDYLVMDFNELEHPVNMEYFIRLWEAKFPETPLTIDQIMFEYDGEHHVFRKDTEKGDLKTAALEVKDYEGEYMNDRHITRVEKGTVPYEAVANLRGVKGEVPGEHRNRLDERWEEFLDDIKENGILEPIFITVDWGQEPKISEGNHRRDAAGVLHLEEVPVEIRYYGRAETTTKVAMPLGVPSEYKLVNTGKLGESLVPLIPGVTEVESVKLGFKKKDFYDVDFSIQFEGVKYGAEVKTNDRATFDPYRYKLSAYGRTTLAQVRELKTDFCAERGLVPATLGITIDFENSTFDACLLRGEVRTFLGGAKTLIANDVSFENTNKVVPLRADTKYEQRIPKPFVRPGETSQPSWKMDRNKPRPEAPSPEDVF